MTVLLAVPIPFITTFPIFGLLLFILLFLGGFILPALIGIMLTAVKQHQRGSANSIAQLSYNMLGYMPAPSLYGYLQDIYNEDPQHPKSGIPLGVIIYSTFVTVTMATIAILKQLNVEL